MVRIIKAEVVSHSLDSKTHRVKVKADGFYEEESLEAVVVGAVPLKKGDRVMLDISNGLADPIVLGKVRDNNYKTNATLEGSQIFESEDDGGWSVLTAKGDIIQIENSSGVKVVIKAGVITINGGNLGGLINIESITAKLNQLVSQVNNIGKALKTHTHQVPGVEPGAGAATAVVTTTNVPSASDFKKGDYEDVKVLH